MKRDEGSVLVLGVFYVLIALALILVVAAATAVHLERKRLLAYADQIALAAADAVDIGLYYASSDPVPVGTVLISQATVDTAVSSFIAQTPAQASQFTDLAVTATTTDNRTVTVTLNATASIPVLADILAAWNGGIRLQVTSHASSQ